MKQTILIFGGLSVAILLLLQLSKLSLLSSQSYSDTYIFISGSLFILIGFLLRKFLYKRSGMVKEVTIDREMLKITKLSNQEFKILTLMADGLSNFEIGENLFISENTVKTC